MRLDFSKTSPTEAKFFIERKVNKVTLIVSAAVLLILGIISLASLCMMKKTKKIIRYILKKE